MIPGYRLTVAGFSFSSEPDVTFGPLVSSLNMIGIEAEKRILAEGGDGLWLDPGYKRDEQGGTDDG